MADEFCVWGGDSLLLCKVMGGEGQLPQFFLAQSIHSLGNLQLAKYHHGKKILTNDTSVQIFLAACTKKRGWNFNTRQLRRVVILF